MPQLAMRQQIAMGQFSLTRQLLMAGQQQVAIGAQQKSQQQQPPQQQAAQKPTKVTKVRRARQSRNPLLSVARRNERERNRVKMVNNGFALLRDHLPIEYLQQTSGGYESGSDTPDLGPVGAKSPGSQSSKAKKFSKVETLRAAIQHIKMLQELMRSADPNFESINIQQEAIKQEEVAANSIMGYDDIDSGPLSCGDGPLSCGSSSSLTSSSLAGPQQANRQTAAVYAREQLAANPEQFVKLEPFVSAGQVHFQPQHQPSHIQPASPLESAGTTIQTTPVSQHQQQQQQHNSLYSQAPAMMTQVQHQQTIASSETATSEHTHLWIQQHQTSFMEQQQQQQYTMNQDHWSPYQQQQQYVQQQELSPSNMHYQQQQQQIQFASQQPQLDSPPVGHWFAPSPPNSTSQQQVANESVNFAGHHQISLYSQ